MRAKGSSSSRCNTMRNWFLWYSPTSNLTCIGSFAHIYLLFILVDMHSIAVLLRRKRTLHSDFLVYGYALTLPQHALHFCKCLNARFIVCMAYELLLIVQCFYSPLDRLGFRCSYVDAAAPEGRGSPGAGALGLARSLQEEARG